MEHMLLKEFNSFLNKQDELSSHSKEDFYDCLHYGNFRENKDYKKILLSSLLTIDVIHHAIKNKFQLIISSDSIFEYPISNIDRYLLPKLTLLTRNNLCIFKLSKNRLNFNIPLIIEGLLALKHELLLYQGERRSNSQIGHVYSPIIYPIIKKTDFLLQDLISRIKTNFELTIVKYVGNLKNVVKKILITFNKESIISNRTWLDKVTRLGCDCIILNSITHDFAKISLEFGLNLIELSYQKLISLWMENFCKILNLEYPYDEFDYYKSKNLFEYWI